MQAKQWLYQAGKRTVDLLPPWMLRVRPFGVYSIPLAFGESTQSHQSDSRRLAIVVRWLESDAEREALSTIADLVNLTAWNGTTRRAVVAWRSSESTNLIPIGIAWLATESFDEPQLGLHMELEPEDAWLHSAFVVPSFRRQGVYQALLRYTIGSLQREGYRRLLLGVAVGNEPSRRAQDAVGATEIGSISAIRSGGFSLCYVTGSPKCASGGRVGFGKSIHLKISGKPETNVAGATKC